METDQEGAAENTGYRFGQGTRLPRECKPFAARSMVLFDRTMKVGQQAHGYVTFTRCHRGTIGQDPGSTTFCSACSPPPTVARHTTLLPKKRRSKYLKKKQSVRFACCQQGSNLEARAPWAFCASASTTCRCFHPHNESTGGERWWEAPPRPPKAKKKERTARTRGLRDFAYLVKRNLHRALDVPLAEVDGVLHELHLRGVPEQQQTGRQQPIAHMRKNQKTCGRRLRSTKPNVNTKVVTHAGARDTTFVRIPDIGRWHSTTDELNFNIYAESFALWATRQSIHCHSASAVGAGAKRMRPRA